MHFRAQLSPVYAIEDGDFNIDGFIDIIIGGYFDQSKPDLGSYNASFGTYLMGLGNSQFEFVPNAKAGISIDGAVRDIENVRIADSNVLIFTINSNKIYSVEYGKQ